MYSRPFVNKLKQNKNLSIKRKQRRIFSHFKVGNKDPPKKDTKLKSLKTRAINFIRIKGFRIMKGKFLKKK